jgi:hypothetical protein
MRVPTLNERIPTPISSAILGVATVVAFGLIFVSGHFMSNPGSALQLSIASSSPKLVATAQSAVTTATSSPKVTVVATTTSQGKVVAGVPVTELASPSIVSTTTLAARALAGSGADLLKSVVNIVCLSGNSSIPSISGSGVIIDSRGIILTAAHVAQLFLLQDYLGPSQVQCIIRDGSPARRAYTAEPIYVSPSWIKANPDTLETASPIGTGENDFAFLGITGTATSTPVPSSFPYIPLAQDDPQLNEPVAIGSYGAQYLTSAELNYDLYPIIVFGNVNARYTFGTNTVDLISVDGSAASQEGSSGGGMVNAADELVGTITTSSVNGSIAGRSLNAVTVGHMRRSFAVDMDGQSLDAYLADNSVSTLIADFHTESNVLAQSIKY